MSTKWIYTTQNSIYTVVKTKAKANLKTDYPNIDFTQEEAVDKYAKFPTVYIHSISNGELGRTLECDSVNGYMSSFQIDVFVDASQGITGLSNVMFEVIDQFKALRYTLAQQPETMSTGNTDYKRMTARVRRPIGYDDIVF